MNKYRMRDVGNRKGHRAARGVALAVVVGLLVSASPRLSAASSATAPLNLVRQLVVRVLSLVNDKSMAQSEKAKRLRELGSANFDFKEMSRSAMGRSWRSLSADQRQRFIPVFTSFLEDAYLNKIQNYSGQQIQITTAHVTGKEYAEASGRIVQKGSEPIGLGFSLRREGNAWKIYDISIDNVGTLDSYRTEFQQIMHDKGFDEIMAQIERRDRELASTLGSPTGLPF
jgi:phospholipid transport system substrate-binding protein